MLRHFLVGAMQNGLVTRGLDDAGFGVVGDRQQRDSAIKGIGMNMGRNPGAELLIRERLGEDPMRGAQSGDKHRGWLG